MHSHKDDRPMAPKTRRYAYFCHTQCEYFPCHETANPADFNCLFCYCPLYALGPDCGGNFHYTEQGVKDCSRCLLPHTRAAYADITARFTDIRRLADRKPE